MVSYDLAILRDATEAISRLGRDQIKMNAYAATVASLPLPAEGSAAEKALSCRPMVVSYVGDLVFEIDRQLTVLAQNLHDTAEAYQRGEAENVLKINRFWDDLGESPARQPSDPGDYPKRENLDFDEPSKGLTDPVELVEPSLLPNQVIDLVATVTDIPSDVADFMLIYFKFLLVVTPGEDPENNEWAKAAMGEYGPISKVGNGYSQLGRAYFELSNQFEQIGKQLKHGWTGDTAELAADYLLVVLRWIRSDVAHGIDFVGGRYEKAAAALYRDAARAAGAISGYQDVLEDLLEDVTLGLAEKRKPHFILWRTVSKAAAVAAKKLLVVNTVAKLLQVAGNLLDDFYTKTPIAPGSVQPPRRA
ncbi:hypothetical protein [Amycolatopsis albispora]|uniref:Uncharacterized protein n=1 Tax=Amycolatopsis albispora TaxID=1804986 RepID=A0A344L2S4_9PSEU|nr:hypothetical protein [Amycolatopsis albispora]AXB42348.1 hypothetical protein A4R43_07260 [Amycolatopsis albispora]